MTGMLMNFVPGQVQKKSQQNHITKGSNAASSSGASFFAWQRRARNEWLVMNHKGPWEGYKRQAKPVVSFPPSCARTFSSKERRLGTRQGEVECAKVWENDFRFVFYWEFASVFFFVMKTQANFLTSVKLETILASKLFKNCWAVGLTCDKSTSLQSLFMAISRSCHVHVRLWYSSVGITRLKLCTSMMFRSFSPCQDRKTIFSFNYCKMTQNTGDEECACCGFFLARF